MFIKDPLMSVKELNYEEERLFTVLNLMAVDHTILSVDDDRSVCATFEKNRRKF